MEITFKNNKLHKICASEKQLIRTYGSNCARKMTSRFDDLQAAISLAAFKALPGRCHELKGNKKGQFSLDLEHPLRLIFEPSNEDVQKQEDGGLDWNSVKAIKIIGVEDTHE
jgi:proteic killer suppression protein